MGEIDIATKENGILLEKINPLGFVLRGEGLRPSEYKIAALRDYPTPTNLDEVNRFLWMTTYLRHFIPGRSDHAVILKAAAQLETKDEWHARDPGRKDKKGRIQRAPRRVVNRHWGPRQERSFKALKTAVIENAVFGGSELRQYHLSTDASKTGIGGILFQLLNCEPGTKVTIKNRSDMRIIMFISLRLADAVTRYSTTEQETLAVLRCLKKLSWLVQGSAHPVFVYTDHSALIHLLKHDDAHGKMARWQQKHSHYDLEYLHVPGSQNAIADGLSRMPSSYFEKRKIKLKKKKERGGKVERGGIGERIGEGGRNGSSDRESNDGKRKGKLEGGGNGKRDRLGRESAQVLALGIAGGEVGTRVGAEMVREGGTVEKEEIWEVWKASDWYGEVMRFLLRGDFGGRGLGKDERRRIRGWARRLVLFDGERRKGLFYKEKDWKLALCVMSEDVARTLECYYDCHGHFAGRLLTENLLGKAYWPMRVKDAHYFARTCVECQAMGPIKPSVGVKPIIHLQPFDMVCLDFISSITPVLAQGNRYIVIMVDYFTRFFFARAVAAATGEAARTLFNTVTETFGDPLAAYTDNGQHLLGDEFHGTLVKRGIQHFPAPKTHPSSGGLAERYVQLVM